MKIDNGTGGSRETLTEKAESVEERGRESINLFVELKRRNVHTIAVVSLSCGVFINQISYSCRLFAMVTTNGIHMAHAEPDGVERG